MSEGIYLSYDALVNIIIVVLIAIIGWLIIYFSRLNKKIDKINTRLNSMDIENAKKEEQIKFLFDPKYNPFQKGEKEKWATIKIKLRNFMNIF